MLKVYTPYKNASFYLLILFCTFYFMMTFSILGVGVGVAHLALGIFCPLVAKVLQIFQMRTSVRSVLQVTQQIFNWVQAGTFQNFNLWMIPFS